MLKMHLHKNNNPYRTLCGCPSSEAYITRVYPKVTCKKCLAIIKKRRPPMAHDYDDEVQTPDAPISMNKEWRPGDWLNPYPKADEPLNINSKNQIGFNRVVYEHGASAMLAARDKDWIAWGEGHYDTLCVIDCDAKDRGHGCIIIRADKWEARKKEINP
jgi:hypothetical protein